MSRPLSAALCRQSGPGGHAIVLCPPPGLISRLLGDRQAALPSRQAGSVFARQPVCRRASGRGQAEGRGKEGAPAQGDARKGHPGAGLTEEGLPGLEGGSSQLPRKEGSSEAFRQQRTDSWK